MDHPQPSRVVELIQKIRDLAPADDPKIRTYLAELQAAAEAEQLDAERIEEEVSKLREAYEKLTQPANRTGTFLNWLTEDQALILLGDAEYVALIDPAVDREEIRLGTRLRLNEAYAIVGTVPETEVGPIAKVTEIVSESRLRLGSDTPGGESRLVFAAPSIQQEAVRVGDEVRLDSTGKIAIEHFAKQEIRDYFFEEVAEVPWESVGGQSEAIKLIKDTIEHPLLYPEIYAKFEKKPIKGILLYGPPGCGKTLIGKATAYNLAREYSSKSGKEVKEYFMHISGPKILNMWLGETERMVREIFAVAREKAKEGRLVFIFMDEAEAVLRTRSSGRFLNISNTVVPQFCAELDGLVSLDNVVLILTSNRPDYIDPAILRPERIDRKVKIGRPDKVAATQILSIYLTEKLPYDPELMNRFDGEVDCVRRELVEQTIQALWREVAETEFLKVMLKSGSAKTLHWKDFVSGALLKSTVDRAKDKAIKRAIASPKKPNGITARDLEDSLADEYSENEIFPKTDAMDDWLKLLDLDPESVANVRPVGRERGESRWTKGIV